MAYRILPDQRYLRECFCYEPLTGEVRWRARPSHHFTTVRDWQRWNNLFADKIAGYRSKGFPRLTVRLGYRTLLLHRVIWKMMRGEDVPELDHRDRDGCNNVWTNLRSTDRNRTRRNSGAKRTSSTGLKGVYHVSKSKRFGAHIRVNGKLLRLGSFATKEGAHAAYCAAARQHFGEFWNPG